MESTEYTGTWEGEKVAFLFQHGTVLPAQYMFARNDRGRAIFDETEQWVTEENNDWLFSFEGICECLGFDPEYIRKGLLLWKNSHLTQQGSGMSQRSEVQCR
jgi:hypothetical protein